MRAIVLDRFGGPEVLRLADVPVPKPKEGEILVQVAYAAVNPVDSKIRQGLLKDLFPHEFPIILGWDAAGLVISVGSNASLYKPGDKVYAYCRKPVVQWGSFAEFIALPEGQVARMPRQLGFKDSACIPLAGLTAWQGLMERGQLQSGQTVLITAGSGGVGNFAIQMARNAGAGVLTTASPRNHELVKSLGAMVAIDYARQDVAAAVKAAVPDGVDLVFDLAGGAGMPDLLRVLKPGGRFVSAVDALDPTVAAKHQVLYADHFVQPNAAQLAELALMFDDGRLKIPPLREYDLRDAVGALALSETRHVQGKIVLKVK